MPKRSEFEALLEDGATEALRKVIVPFMKGSIEAKNLDKSRLNVGVQLVSNHTKMIATKMHERALEIMQEKMRLTSGETTDGR